MGGGVAAVCWIQIDSIRIGSDLQCSANDCRGASKRIYDRPIIGVARRKTAAHQFYWEDGRVRASMSRARFQRPNIFDLRTLERFPIEII